MPGFEVFGKEEQQAINELFEKNGGILFAHGFDAVRNGVYKVREYEQEFATKLNCKYGQAVSSGSAAIKVGLKALGINKGDEVITQAFTFVATVEAIKEVGATPVIVDIDDTLNLNPALIESAISPRTKAIIPVHMMGEGADIKAIRNIASKHSLYILEDTAQALGASINGKFLGTFGDIGAFSTDAGKTLNTGEGGMVLTNNEQLYINARAYHDHGHEYSKEKGRAEESALSSGFNYRMTEIHAAIGLEQLKKLEFILNQQRENKSKLLNGLKDTGLVFRRSVDPDGDIGDTLVFYLPDRERTTVFLNELSTKGIGTKNLPDAIRWHFAKYWKHLLDDCPLYKDRVDTAWSDSADILECAIALPVMVNMSDQQIEIIIDSLTSIAKKEL